MVRCSLADGAVGCRSTSGPWAGERSQVGSTQVQHCTAARKLHKSDTTRYWDTPPSLGIRAEATESL